MWGWLAALWELLLQSDWLCVLLCQRDSIGLQVLAGERCSSYRAQDQRAVSCGCNTYWGYKNNQLNTIETLGSTLFYYSDQEYSLWSLDWPGGPWWRRAVQLGFRWRTTRSRTGQLGTHLPDTRGGYFSHSKNTFECLVPSFLEGLREVTIHTTKNIII